MADRVVCRTGYTLGPEIEPCQTILPDCVNPNDGFTEQEAVITGLWNNPAYQELLADLEIARAALIEARQLQNPQFSTFLPLGPKQWEFALLVPIDVLWLRPRRVAAAQLESHRVAERLVQDGLNVVRDIRVSYVDWRLAVHRAELAQEALDLNQELTRIAVARLKAGEVGELEVSPIQLEVRFRAAETARIAFDVEMAHQRLRYLMGLQRTNLCIDVPAQTPPEEEEVVCPDVCLLVEQAVTCRPDLAAVQLAVAAAEERAEFARRDIWRLSAFLPDFNSRGVKGAEAGPGLQFNVPIFHQNQGAVAREEAGAERLRRQYVNLRDLAAWEVHQAFIQYAQANRDVRIWRDQATPEARRALTSAREALAEDGVPLLLVLESTRQYFTARQRQLDASAQQRRALAELERSVGCRLNLR